MQQPFSLPLLPALHAASTRQRVTARPIMLVGFQSQGNLGLGYLSAVLQQQGYRVVVVDIEQEPKAILRLALQHQPLLIGFSLIFQFYLPRYAALLYVLRRAGIQCHFTMGGHFPSLSFEQTLALIPELDSVVRFEGELTLLELADALSTGRDWQPIQGLAYRRGEEMIVTPPRPLLEHLDELPYPERNYAPETVLGRTIMPIVASRGCARTCSFCSIHTFYRAAPGRIVRTRKPAAVVEEMRHLHEERGISIFLFQDDDFPLFGPVWRRWAGELMAELHRSGLAQKVIWKINCRADAVDRELFLQLKEAGLYLVYMGLESGTEEGLQTLHKQITKAQNLRAVEILNSIGLMWEYGFMLLDPSSTFASVRENLDFLRTILADGCLPATFCRMLPYDGTPIKEELVRTGRLRGDVCNPDYDFLDSRLESFYEGLQTIVNLQGWVHGLEAVTLQLATAWHEVAVMERLFPALAGMAQYKRRLRSLTQTSNNWLLNAVEELSYVYTDGATMSHNDRQLETQRRQILDKLLALRDTFIARHQQTLLAALQGEVQRASLPLSASALSTV